MNVDRLPAGISAALAVRVKRSPLGEFTAAELAYFDTHGRVLEQWHVGGKNGPVLPFKIPSVPPEPVPPRTQLTNRDAPLDANVLLPAAPHSVGNLLELSSTRHVLLDGFVLYETGGSIGLASVSAPDRDIIKIINEF